MSRFLMILTFSVCVFNAQLQAQAPGTKPLDSIDRAKQLQKIADQKAISDVQQQVGDLVKLYRLQPVKAVSDLKSLARQLDLRNDLSATTRESLIRSINVQIVQLTGNTAQQGGTGTGGASQQQIDPKIAAQKEASKKHIEKAALETKEVQDVVTLVSRDIELNRPEQATQRVREIAAKYPDNPAVIQLQKQGDTRDGLAFAKSLSDEQGRRWTFAMNDVQRSALPIKGDIEFPKDWKERQERRKKMEPELLGPEEKAILKSLEKKVPKSLKGMPFEEAIQVLSTLIDQKIYIDENAVTERGLDLKKPVDTPAGVDARTTLRSMLQSQGLTFMIRDKMIQVVTIEKARQNLVTRSYEIRDIIQTGSVAFGAGSIVWGPYLNYQQTMDNARHVIDAITGGIDPRVWKDQGGPATITFHYASMSIIVRAPAEVHSALSGKLSR